MSRALSAGDDQAWLIESKAVRAVADEMKTLQSQGRYTLMVGSIDDFWDGSDQAVIYLTAFMHACLEMSSQVPWARAVVFLRENIFERVRANDSESSRLETAVVGLDWTQEQLLELVERRLNRPFNAKLPLGGATWDAFFEEPELALDSVFDYCHNRPRDVLIYVNHAVESAQAHKHERILLEDVDGARRRFSDNRLKDLGDEYAENYPQIALVLSRFYGLGNSFTVAGIGSFLERLIADSEIQRVCSAWIYEHASVEVFVRLFYNIGFVGLRTSGRDIRFRALGPQDVSPPPISHDVDVVVHKCYWDALDLQNFLVRTLPEDLEFGRKGILTDLPGGLEPGQYIDALDEVEGRLASVPRGSAGARAFEQVVGDVLRLCFYRVLENVEERVRSIDGGVVRDWVTSNRAQSGFWSVMRTRYNATQVVWECKNYDDLKADDFHQSTYLYD